MNLNDALHGGFVKLKFTKVDNSVREMVCTLAEEFLPEKVSSESEDKKVRTPNPNIQVIYEKDVGWRSFRKDSLIEWEVYDE